MIHEDAFSLHQRDGLEIRGETFAETKDPSRTVVICHGFKGFAHWGFFPYLARAVAAAGMRAITFDFSGSGVGDDRETFSNPAAFEGNTFSRELADLDAVIREARKRKWISSGYGLIGHSRGGGVAILHASVSPAVTTLVTWAAISHVVRWTPDDVSAWKKRGYVDIVNARTGLVLKLGTSVIEDVEQHSGNSLDVGAAASRVQVPWLILHGSEDETVPQQEADRLHKLAPGSTLKIIEKGNHGFGAMHPFDAAPENLETAVRETIAFLDQHLG